MIPPCSDDPAPNVTCKPKNPQLIDHGVEGGKPYRLETSVANGSDIKQDSILYRYASTEAAQEFRLRIGKVAEQPCIRLSRAILLSLGVLLI